MAKVFPEEMNPLNVEDVRGSIRTIEDYIRYMTERMEFANTQTRRAASESGITDIAVLEVLNDMAATMATLTSTVNSMRGDVTALQERVSALEQK